MDSPSAQLIDDPPSSPFISEVDAQSRIASKQWDGPIDKDDNYHNDEHIEDVFMTPHKPVLRTTENKENTPRSGDNIMQKSLLSSSKLMINGNRTYDHLSTPRTEQADEGSDAVESDLRQSIRQTPRRSPLKAIHNTASTPKSVRREGFQEKSGISNSGSMGRKTPVNEARTPPQDYTNVDDTCFSAFSEIPDMTVFAKLRQSTTTRDEERTPGRQINATPRTSRKRSSPSRSPSPTPRRMKTPAHVNSDGTTSFLIDFTQQMENVSSYRSPGKTSTQPNLLNYLNSKRSPNKSVRQSFATPAKSSSLLNLLDFELPPAPTPRSIPTITVRELESLKSSYLSQISSLKATLSGRDAEVESLKRAISDAERRAGEAQEAQREEQCRRENAEEEKAQWERRGQEVENVLKNVREEVLKGEAEKEDLLRQIEDGERRADEAEERARKAEERAADALVARTPRTGEDGTAGEEDENNERVQRLVAAQIDAKIEAVSRELHAVYKEKHERKVATLKRSYEARSEKKTAELHVRLAELEMQLAQRPLESKEDHHTSNADTVSTSSGPRPEDAALKAQLEEQRAQFAGLEKELATSRQQQAELARELAQERIEKGELVAAVDEMLALQQADPSAADPQQQAAVSSVVEDFRKSIARPTGLRAPAAGMGESRIGRGGGLAGSGSRVVSGAGKSKMLANIERMGRTVSASGTENGHE